MNQGSRQNLVYNRKGEIVYPAACAGVVMTKSTKPQQHRQAYNLDHTQVTTHTIAFFTCRATLRFPFSGATWRKGIGFSFCSSLHHLSFIRSLSWSRLTWQGVFDVFHSLKKI